MNAIPKLVASRTLKEPLEWNATLIKGDVVQEIAKLKQEPGRNIEMYGSTALMQTLMQHDLIDKYRIWVHPLILGTGKRLFPENGHGMKLELKETKTRSSGVVGLILEPASAAAEIHILTAGEAEIRRTGLGSQRSSMTCVPRIVDFGAAHGVDAHFAFAPLAR